MDNGGIRCSSDLRRFQNWFRLVCLFLVRRWARMCACRFCRFLERMLYTGILLGPIDDGIVALPAFLWSVPFRLIFPVLFRFMQRRILVDGKRVERHGRFIRCQGVDRNRIHRHESFIQYRVVGRKRIHRHGSFIQYRVVGRKRFHRHGWFKSPLL